MNGATMIYLASPYSHQYAFVREERFAAVCKVSAKLMRDGHHIYSPIAHSHPIASHGDLPTGFDYWREYDWWFIEHVDELWVLMLDGWESSVGVTAEIKYARQLGKPVKYLTRDGDEHAGCEEVS